MALVGNVLLGTGSAPGMSSIISSIASAYADSAASSRIPWSALDYSGQVITSISGSAIGGQGMVHTYTGVSPVVVDNTMDLISLSATSVHLDSSLRTYSSGTSAMVGLTYPTVIVGNSSQATANNVIYIVTGSN